MIIWANRLIVAVALVLFVRLVQRATGDRAGWLAAAAASGALLLSSPFESVLAPTNAAAFAAACAVMFARSRTVMALALLTGIAPPLLAPGAILGAGIVLTRTSRGLRRVALMALAIAAVTIGPAIVA